MSHIIIATVENGLLRPDAPLSLPAMTRVRLTIEPLTPSDEQATPGQDSAWAELDRIWEDVDIDSGGPPPSRDQLHDRR